MRPPQSGGHCCGQVSLGTTTSAEQWYVEDPFDLRHNLAGKCSLQAKRRIVDAMRETSVVLRREGDWAWRKCKNELYQ